MDNMDKNSNNKQQTTTGTTTKKPNSQSEWERRDSLQVYALSWSFATLERWVSEVGSDWIGGFQNLSVREFLLHSLNKILNSLQLQALVNELFALYKEINEWRGRKGEGGMGWDGMGGMEGWRDGMDGRML